MKKTVSTVLSLLMGVVLGMGPASADVWPDVGDPTLVGPARAAAEAADTLTRADHNPEIPQYRKASVLYRQAAGGYERARIALINAPCGQDSAACRQNPANAAVLQKAVARLWLYSAQMENTARDHEFRGLP